MPYYLDWMDETRRILKLQLVNPLERTDLDALRDEFLSLYRQPEPLYVLADFSNFSWTEIQSLGYDDDTSDLEVGPRSNFAVALLGTGALLRWLVNAFANRVAPMAFRAFEYEDRAYSWLSELADGQSG